MRRVQHFRRVRAIVTPRMHGIHHSSVRDERDSNWSSGLTVWDWLHGTVRLDIPQDVLTIGVPGHLDRDAVILSKLLAMPFQPRREIGRSPDPGRSMAAAWSGRIFPDRARRAAPSRSPARAWGC